MADKPTKPAATNPWAGASKLRSRAKSGKSKSSSKSNAWTAYTGGGGSRKR